MNKFQEKRNSYKPSYSNQCLVVERGDGFFVDANNAKVCLYHPNGDLYLEFDNFKRKIKYVIFSQKYIVTIDEEIITVISLNLRCHHIYIHDKMDMNFPLALSSCETFLAINNGKTITIWNLNDRKKYKVLDPYLTWVDAMFFSPDGNKIAISCIDDNFLVIMDVEGNGYYLIKTCAPRVLLRWMVFNDKQVLFLKNEIMYSYDFPE